MGVLTLLVVVTLVLGLGIVLALRTARIRFSLRTLLLATALIAAGLGGFLAWRTAGMAKTAWLDPASAEAQQLSPESAVEVVGDRFRLIYRTRYRHLSPLTAGIKWPARHNAAYDENRKLVKIETDDRKALDAALAALQQADVLPQGKFVIRGVVVDAAGDPVAPATVDLRGNHVYIDGVLTRDDGTFTMPLDVPAGSGYSLRVHCKDGPARDTRSFSLSADEPERIVRIEVD